MKKKQTKKPSFASFLEIPHLANAFTLEKKIKFFAIISWQLILCLNDNPIIKSN